MQIFHTFGSITICSQFFIWEGWWKHSMTAPCVQMLILLDSAFSAIQGAADPKPDSRIHFSDRWSGSQWFVISGLHTEPLFAARSRICTSKRDRVSGRGHLNELFINWLLLHLFHQSERDHCDLITSPRATFPSRAKRIESAWKPAFICDWLRFSTGRFKRGC